MNKCCGKCKHTKLNTAKEKQELLDNFLKTVTMTRAGEDIICLEYVVDDYGDEYVNINFNNNAKKRVCITANSMIAILGQICEALY